MQHTDYAAYSKEEYRYYEIGKERWTVDVFGHILKYTGHFYTLKYKTDCLTGSHAHKVMEKITLNALNEML